MPAKPLTNVESGATIAAGRTTIRSENPNDPQHGESARPWAGSCPAMGGDGRRSAANGTRIRQAEKVSPALVRISGPVDRQRGPSGPVQDALSLPVRRCLRRLSERVGQLPCLTAPAIGRCGPLMRTAILELRLRSSASEPGDHDTCPTSDRCDAAGGAPPNPCLRHRSGWRAHRPTGGSRASSAKFFSLERPRHRTPETDWTLSGAPAIRHPDDPMKTKNGLLSPTPSKS